VIDSNAARPSTVLDLPFWPSLPRKGDRAMEIIITPEQGWEDIERRSDEALKLIGG
jgi:hypothetical protein